MAPNLLFVFPDQMRRQAMGFMGADPVITPNLDRFAKQSRVMTSAVSTYPLCSPYRGILFTGTYPHVNGVLHNCNAANAKHGVQLGQSDRCISDVLHDAGYCCGYIGKWHLESPHEPYVEKPREDGVWDEFTPPGPRRHHFDFWHSYGCCDDHLHPHYWDNTAPRERPIRVDEWSPRHEAEVAIEYLRNSGGQRDAGKPFALFVSMNPPHTPFAWVPPEYGARYGDATPQDLLVRGNVDLSLTTQNTQRAAREAKNYFGAITGVDEQFGRILTALDDLGLADNTCIIFTSDHGELMGSHDMMHKNVIYEESLGIPLLIRLPGVVRPGSDDLLIGTADLFPTILGLLGLQGMTQAAVQGLDLSAALRGRAAVRPEAALYYAVNVEDAQRGKRGLRTARYTFLVDRDVPGGAQVTLFDNERDPYQMTNVAGAEPELAARLTEQLHAMLKGVADPWATA